VSRRGVTLIVYKAPVKLVPIVDLQRLLRNVADLQALRYAAMVSQMTLEEAVETYGAYLRRLASMNLSLTVLLSRPDASMNSRIALP
jgi:hypothetical protein